MKLQRPANDQPELLDIDRLPIEVVSAAVDGGQRAFARAVAARHDDLGVGFQAHDLVEHGETLAGAVRIGRQAEIESHDGRFFGPQRGDRAGPVAGDDDVEIVVCPLELRLQTLVILDDQQLGSRLGHHATFSLVSCIDRMSSAASASGR